jgi:hypothetical protein
MSTVGTVA